MENPCSLLFLRVFIDTNLDFYIHKQSDILSETGTQLNLLCKGNLLVLFIHRRHIFPEYFSLRKTVTVSYFEDNTIHVLN